MVAPPTGTCTSRVAMPLPSVVIAWASEMPGVSTPPTVVKAPNLSTSRRLSGLAMARSPPWPTVTGGGGVGFRMIRRNRLDTPGACRFTQAQHDPFRGGFPHARITSPVAHRRGPAARPGVGPVAAQAPIKVGDINSYSGIGAPFTGPYRAGVEMAVEEINARGGVLGRKLEVIFRDDKGQPAEAIKHAQELVESDKVVMVTGSFLSNVGLAVSDWAKQNK